MAEEKKRRATTFRTSKGVVVSVTYPDIYIQPGFVLPEDVTSPAELREALRAELTPWRGAISIHLDDLLSGIYTDFVPLLRALDMQADLVPQITRIGTAGWMTWDQIRELMFKDGYGVLWHGTSDLETVFTPAEVEYIVVSGHETLLRRQDPDGNFTVGLQPSGMVWPSGIIPSPSRMGIIKQFYPLGFTGWEGSGATADPSQILNVQPYVGNYAIQSLTLADSYWTATKTMLPSLLETAEKKRGWVIFRAHSGANFVSPPRFKSFLDYVAASGLPVVTTGGVINALEPGVLLRAPYDDKIVEKITNKAASNGVEYFTSEYGLSGGDVLGGRPVRGLGYREYTFYVRATQAGTARIYISDSFGGTYHEFDSFTFLANTLTSYHTTHKLPYIDLGITLNVNGTINYSRVVCTR